MNMREGIRDTSAQDVQIDRPARWKKLKWILPLAAVAIVLALFSSVISTWLNAEASISADRIRTALVNRGDLVRILRSDRHELGRGLIAYANADAVRIIGRKTDEIAEILGFRGRSALIHRDDLTRHRAVDRGPGTREMNG